MSEHRVNPDLIHRTAWGNPLWNALQNLNIYGMCLAGSLVVSFIWPLALPACLLFTLITVLIFSLQRWRCPLRMPMTLRCADPSQDRMIKRSLFEFWPTLFQYETIKEFPANGIFYVGYQRIRDIGRELWLNIDDLTRHVMFFAATGGGKTETIFSWIINPLCWGRGFTLVDGKAQNDTARTIWYLSRRFGREDDVEVINFMNGGKSRSEIILSGDKSRPQSNTWNPFCCSTEAFTAETMQSMLPQNVQGGEWQSRAIAMNKALVFGTKFWCVREGRTMSLQMLREHMSLEGMAKLYCRGIDDQWPEEAIAPLRNYLQDVPGFDMSLVRTPSAWTEEPRKQHAYLSGQFSETFSTFTEAFGDIFAEDSGDIDIRDSIHSDRILMVMLPALDTSAHTTSALGRMFVTQQSMILARDLGYRLEGSDSQALEVKKYKGRFPYIPVSVITSVVLAVFRSVAGIVCFMALSPVVSGCRVSLVTPRRSESSSCRPLLQELLPAVDLSGGAPVTTSRGGCPGADAKVFDACGKKFCGRYISPWTAETGCGYFSPRKVRLRGTGRRSGSGRINSSAIRRCDLTPRKGCGERRFRRDRGG